MEKQARLCCRSEFAPNSCAAPYLGCFGAGDLSPSTEFPKSFSALRTVGKERRARAPAHSSICSGRWSACGHLLFTQVEMRTFTCHFHGLVANCSRPEVGHSPGVRDHHPRPSKPTDEILIGVIVLGKLWLMKSLLSRAALKPLADGFSFLVFYFLQPPAPSSSSSFFVFYNPPNACLA